MNKVIQQLRNDLATEKAFTKELIKGKHMSDPIALSFSRLSDYEQCPLKFKSKYITKVYPDDSNNPAFAKGSAIHKQLENYINFVRNEGDIPKMGQHASNASNMIDKLNTLSKGNIYPEKQLAVDMNYKKCDWFAKPTKVKWRAIIDCLVFLDDETLLIIDWKSGKFREYEDGPTTQLKLTAVILFNLYPNIKNITSSYMFVEHKRTVKVDFKRDQLASMQEKFDDAYTIVNQDGDFQFKKNKYCNWCLLDGTICPVKK